MSFWKKMQSSWNLPAIFIQAKVYDIFFNNSMTKLILPFIPLLVVLFFVTFGVSMCNFFLVPFAFKKVLNVLSMTEMEGLYQIWVTVFIYLTSCLFLVLIFRIQNLVWIYLGPKIRVKTHLTCSRHVLSEHFYLTKDLSPSKTASAVKDLVAALPKMFQTLYDGFFSGILSLIIATYTVWSVKYTFGLGLIIWIGVYVVVSTFIIKKSKNYAKKTLNINTAILVKTDELLENIENIKLLSREKYEISKLKSMFYDAYEVDKEKEKFKLKIYGFQGLSFIIYQTISFLLLIQGYREGYITVGDIGLILTINFSFVDYFRKVSKELVEFSDYLGTVSQALSFLSIKNEAVELFPSSRSMTQTSTFFTTVGISFCHLSFRYSESSTLFEDINLDILPGERVVIMGESGSGKSTLVDLITGLKKPTDGKIFFNGHEMNLPYTKSLRQCMGVVHQKMGIFSGSIMDNILYGNFKASEEDIRQAARWAHIDSFIENLPEGYQTYISANYPTLSRGQYQRIVLARALIRKAQIMIFDEATSHLDFETMIQVEKNLIEFTMGKTAIFITHHPSDVLLFAADTVLLVNQGKVVRIHASYIS